MGLQGVTRRYTGLHEVTGIRTGYMGLKEVTKCYIALEGVT